MTKRRYTLDANILIYAIDNQAARLWRRHQRVLTMQ